MNHELKQEVVRLANLPGIEPEAAALMWFALKGGPLPTSQELENLAAEIRLVNSNRRE